jgi:Zn-finger nucleic acid-binding protein
LVRCPVCESARVVVVLSPTPRAFCVKCSARWIQDGILQRQVQHPGGQINPGRMLDTLADEPSA